MLHRAYSLILRVPSRVPGAVLALALALVLALVLALGAAGCAGLPGIVERPHVSVDSTRISGVTLDGADLLVRFRVDNPNSFGLDLSGMDYALDVAGRTVFEGDRRQRLTLEPSASGLVDLPIRIRFADVYQVARDVIRDRGREEIGYTVRAGLRFQLPVVGEIRVPAEARGDLPLVGALARGS
jgi:LEA14-like dessication related protein